MAKEERFYGAGPKVGQPIQEYPKCLYRGEESRVVADEAEHETAEAEGWSEQRGNPQQPTPASDLPPSGEATEPGTAEEPSPEEGGVVSRIKQAVRGKPKG